MNQINLFLAPSVPSKAGRGLLGLGEERFRLQRSPGQPLHPGKKTFVEGSKKAWDLNQY